MNFKKLGLAIAVTAAAGSANALNLASDDAGNTSGSSLLFAAYDGTNALYVDLGVTARTFDGAATYNYDLNAAATAGGVSLSSVQWAVVAGDGVVGGGACNTDVNACGRAALSTVASSATLPASFASTTMGGVVNNVDNQWFAVNRSAIESDANNSTVVADGSNGDWDNGINAFSLWDNVGNTGESLAFAMASSAGEAGFFGNGEAATANVSTFDGLWTLDANGGLSYAAAVPVPAAVWMFASGLVGLAGVARRRKQA